MLTHRNLLANLEQMERASPMLAEAENDVVLLVLPLFHIYALNVILGPDHEGRRHRGPRRAVRPGGDARARGPPRRAPSCSARPRCSWRGCALPPDASPTCPRVRLAVSGAARLPGEVLEGFRDRFGVTIWEGYGLTETAPARHLERDRRGRQAQLDRPARCPGSSSACVDEHDEEVFEDDTGEIVVRGPNLFAGYWNRPEETERRDPRRLVPHRRRRLSRRGRLPVHRRPEEGPDHRLAASTSSRRRSRTRSSPTRTWPRPPSSASPTSEPARR